MKPKHKLPPWLKPKGRPTGSSVGVGWYTAEEWVKVKNSAADPERFEDTYTEWVEMAEKALLDLRAVGINARKYPVIASELLAWCVAHGKVNDAAARAEYIVDPGRFKSGGA
jgi:hypothetical protein